MFGSYVYNIQIISSKDKGLVFLPFIPSFWLEGRCEGGSWNSLIVPQKKVAYWEYESDKIEIQVSDDNEAFFP